MFSLTFIVVLIVLTDTRYLDTRYPVPAQCFNPFRTPVPFWGQTTWNLSELPPKRDCGSKRVKVLLRSTRYVLQVGVYIHSWCGRSETKSIYHHHPLPPKAPKKGVSTCTCCHTSFNILKKKLHCCPFAYTYMINEPCLRISDDRFQFEENSSVL